MLLRQGYAYANASMALYIASTGGFSHSYCSSGKRRVYSRGRSILQETTHEVSHTAIYDLE